MRNSTTEMASTLDCFDSLAALREEISVAIDCISRDALCEFELSLWRQEMLCARIKRTIRSTSVSQASREMRQRIREMCIALKSQSQSYAALIHKCNRSSAILQGLCYLYGPSKEPSRGIYLSVSCEA